MNSTSCLLKGPKKGVFLGLGIASFSLALLGVLLPILFFDRAIQSLLVFLSVASLLLFGFLGVFLVLEERELSLKRDFLRRNDGPSSTLEGVIEKKENLTYRKDEPMTWIRLDGDRAILWCRWFGEFEGEVGDRFRFEISSMNVIVSWERMP